MNGRLFLSQIDTLIQRLDSVGIRVPEDSALIGLANDLVPLITHVLRESLALMVAVEKTFDSTHERRPIGAEALPDSLAEIAKLIAAETAEREVVDLAYFAQIELQHALESLQRAQDHDEAVLVASSCESSLKRARRSLVSLESTLHEFEELEPPARHWVDLEMSLQIRRLYRSLRQDILARRAGDEAVPENVLRRVLYHLVGFRELRIYPFLRVDDRVHLRELLRRMVLWLNGKERSVEDARQLWSSLYDFAQVLAQVSYRQELREHDLSLVKKVFHLLFEGAVPLSRVPETLVAELHALLGLDEDLDRLILDPDRVPVAAWHDPLSAHLERLDNHPRESLVPQGFVAR